MKRRLIKISLIFLLLVLAIFLVSLLFNKVVYPMTYNEDYIEKLEEHPDWTCDENGCTYETDEYRILTGGHSSSVIFQLKERMGNDLYYYDIKDNSVSLPLHFAGERKECFVTVIRSIHCDFSEGLSMLWPREKMYIREMIGVVRRSIR